MKKILVLTMMSLVSFSSYASSCRLSIVGDDVMRSELTQLAQQKGYRIIEATSVENVLKVPEALVINVDLYNIASNDGCSRFTDGRVECGIDFEVGEVHNDGYLYFDRIATSIQSSKSSLFTSQDKIVKKFKAQALEKVSDLIPACNY